MGKTILYLGHGTFSPTQKQIRKYLHIWANSITCFITLCNGILSLQWCLFPNCFHPLSLMFQYLCLGSRIKVFQLLPTHTHKSVDQPGKWAWIFVFLPTADNINIHISISTIKFDLHGVSVHKNPLWTFLNLFSYDVEIAPSIT